MRTVALFFLASLPALAQGSHAVYICDQQDPQNCVTITTLATLSSDFTLGVGPQVLINTAGLDSQVRFSSSAAGTDSGGFLTSSASNSAAISGGAEYSSSGWTARANNAAIVQLSGGSGVGIYSDTGLTSGSLYTPTEIVSFAPSLVKIFTTLQLSGALASQGCIGTDGSSNVIAGTCAGGSVPGSNQDVIINKSGAFGVDTGLFTYDYTTHTLKAPALAINTVSVSAGGVMTLANSLSPVIVSDSASFNSIETAGGYSADDAGGSACAFTVNGSCVITHTGAVPACPTCLTTAGGQTIASSDTFSGGLTAGGDILASGAVNLGSNSGYFTDGYIDSVFLQASYYEAGFTSLNYQMAISNSTSPLVYPLVLHDGLANNIIAFTGAATPTVKVFNTLQLAALTSEACLGTDSSGNVIGCTGGSGTVTSIATSGPITGGTITTTGTISCSSCLTTAGGQTISGVDTWQASQVFDSFIQFYNGTSGALQFEMNAPAANLLSFLTSTGGGFMTLDASGACNAGTSRCFDINAGIRLAPNVNDTVNLYILPASGQTKDIIDIQTTAGFIFAIDNVGDVNLATGANVVISGGSTDGGFYALDHNSVYQAILSGSGGLFLLDHATLAPKFRVTSTDGVIHYYDGYVTAGSGIAWTGYSTSASANTATSVSLTSLGGAAVAAGVYTAHLYVVQTAPATCTVYPAFFGGVDYTNGTGTFSHDWVSPGLTTALNTFSSSATDFAFAPFDVLLDATHIPEYAIQISAGSCSVNGSYTAYVSMTAAN